jgi:hypothetical protein
VRLSKAFYGIQVEMVVMIVRDQDEVDARQSSNASPGGLRRRGPPHRTGLARSLHCGSVKIFLPSICTKRVE